MIVFSTLAILPIAALSPVANTLISLGVGYIAYQQWRTAREKLRHDLYQRRFDVYSRTLDLVWLLMEGGSVSAGDRAEKHRQFIRGVRESRFLFAEDLSISNLLDQMNDNAFVVRGFWEQISPHAQSLGPEFTKVFEKKEAAMQWMMSNIVSLENKLAPFLAINDKGIGKRS